MKKYIIFTLYVFLFAFTVIGGGLILSACTDNSSYSEDAGEGIDNSQNEDNSNGSDDSQNNDPILDDSDDIQIQNTVTITLRVYRQLVTGDYTTNKYDSAYTGTASAWIEGKSGTQVSETISINSATTTLSHSETLWNNWYPTVRFSGLNNNGAYGGIRGFAFDHIYCSGCNANITDTYHRHHLQTGIFGNGSITFDVYLSLKRYRVDINILNPNGEQDFNSGTMNYSTHWGNQNYTNVNNEQGEVYLVAGSSLMIWNITPTTGYYFKYITYTVYISALISRTSNNGSFIFSLSWPGSNIQDYGTPTGGMDIIITIQMEYLYNIDINILNPSGVQDYLSGTMNTWNQYSGSSYSNITDQQDPYCGKDQEIRISNIIPTTGYYVESVTCSRGTIVESDGTYTYTASFTGHDPGDWDDIIVIQMSNKYYINFDSDNYVRYPYSVQFNSVTGTSTSTIEGNSQNVVISLTSNSTSDQSGPYLEGVPLTVGEEYKWSIELRASRTINIDYFGHEMSERTTETITSSWQTFTNTFTAINYDFFAFTFYSSEWQSGDYLYIRNCAVQKVSDISFEEPLAPITVEYGEAYGTLPTPVRTGYTFNGWYTNSSFTGSPVTSSTVFTQTANHTLYARWTAKTYNNIYHYRNSSGVTSSDTQIRTYNQSFTTRSASYLPYYNSNGWSLYGWAFSNSTIERRYAGNTTISDTTYTQSTSTLSWYAISWRSVYLYFNFNGGSGTNVTLSSAQYWNQCGNIRNSISFTISNSIPTRTGYNFLGWSTSNIATTPSYYPGENYMFNQTYSASQSVTLYAVWQPITYEITLEHENGESASTIFIKYDTGFYSDSATTNQIYTIESVVGLREKAGYDFGGYYTLQNGLGNQIIDETGNIVGNNNFTTSDATIYAKWEATNPAHFDEEKGYWYVEMGMFPQDRVTDSGIISELDNLRNSGSAITQTYQMGGNALNSYTFNGEEYAYLSSNNTYYKVLPVRYVLAGEYEEEFGTESANVTAVTEKIVFTSVFDSVGLSLGEGFVESDLYTNSNSLISSTTIDTELLATRNFTVDKYMNINNGILDSETDEILTANYIVSNVEEIAEVFGECEAEYSDLVSDMLRGKMYWTRGLGSNIKVGESITRFGSVTQTDMDMMLGFRVTIALANFACVL